MSNGGEFESKDPEKNIFHGCNLTAIKTFLTNKTQSKSTFNTSLLIELKTHNQTVYGGTPSSKAPNKPPHNNDHKFTGTGTPTQPCAGSPNCGVAGASVTHCRSLDFTPVSLFDHAIPPFPAWLKISTEPRRCMCFKVITIHPID
jgi:hypothetical protein